jgi:N-methyl-L-proline demethylase
MSNDPLLQPYRLKHLTLRNRIMTTSHEPAYTEDGMPKDRYRLYHLERAKAGVAMVMTAGSASVSRDSPPAFGNVLVWKDEVVPWMRRLADDCHEAGAAVMIQISHLGRRTRWDKGDWLPVVGAGKIARTGASGLPEDHRGLGYRPDHRATMPMRQNGCRRPVSMGWSSNATAT